MVMSTLNLAVLFESIKNEDYVIIKLSDDFPYLPTGADIDIFSRNPESLTRKILSCFNSVIDNKTEVEVHKKTGKIQLDILSNNVITLRFDIYTTQPAYNNIIVKDSFFDIVIEGHICKQYEDFSIKVPSLLDDLIIRYIEYVEYFSNVPDKLKHVDLILSTLGENKDLKSSFLRRLHYFLKLPDKNHQLPSFGVRMKAKLKYYRSLYTKIIYVYKRYGTLYLIRKILKNINL